MLVVAWLFAAASGPEAYMTYTSILASPLGLLVLFGFTLSVCYHALNGVRHLVLDSGEGLTPKVASLSATAVLVLAIVAAIAIWIFAGLVPGVSLTGAA
jgi:succinate dehydrogenase / fumarate reductase cytochrome b subunit